jgi:aldehyde dehydrogenase (NAD+)
MYEQYHPLGIVGVISAFNFPVAVWSWNAALAWICGNVVIWKPSEKTPLCAIACQNIFNEVAKENDLPEGISNLVIADHEIGDQLVNDKRIALVSLPVPQELEELLGKMLQNGSENRFWN